MSLKNELKLAFKDPVFWIAVKKVLVFIAQVWLASAAILAASYFLSKIFGGISIIIIPIGLATLGILFLIVMLVYFNLKD
jgi:hypothetical protein